MELRELVELLYTAHNRFNTIQATWEYWIDNELMRFMQEGLIAHRPKGSVTALTSTSAKEENNRQVTKVRKRIWWQKPNCWRDEEQLESHGNNITILCDGQWYNMDSQAGALYTNVLIPEEQRSHLGIREVKAGSPPSLEDRIDSVVFIDPSFLLTSHDLLPIGDVVHAGREAVRVQATYRKNESRIYESFFWTTADEYELLVDKEYGILLRYSAKLPGQELAVSAVDHVSFDAMIPENIFSFPLP
jgi:hypothetical protein